jgi:hypothetical protein
MTEHTQHATDTNPLTPLLAPAACAATGATAGALAVSASGLTAAGMVGAGGGIGAAAGPVGMVGGAVAGLAAYTVYQAGRGLFGWLREAGQEAVAAGKWLAEEQAAARSAAASWAEMWATEMVEWTHEETDQVPNAEVVASFDAWLERTLGGSWRPLGWKIWTSRVAAMDELGMDPSAPVVTQVRLKDQAAT